MASFKDEFKYNLGVLGERLQLDPAKTMVEVI